MLKDTSNGNNSSGPGELCPPERAERDEVLVQIQFNLGIRDRLALLFGGVAFVRVRVPTYNVVDVVPNGTECSLTADFPWTRASVGSALLARLQTREAV